jgi:type IV pilus assembly protein PilA
MLQKLRRRAEDEKGFTLIELLVVILIIGILAAIAIPAFLNQRGKAYDAATKSNLRTAQTAEETYATDSGGKYTDTDTSKGTADALVQIEPSLSNQPFVTGTAATGGGYTLNSTSIGPAGGQITYTIVVGADGSVKRTCTAPGKGGCHAADSAGNQW